MAKKRTIVYCQYTITRKGLDVKDTSSFDKMLAYIEKSEMSIRSYDFKNPEKVAAIESVDRRNDGFIWIVFKTGRYGHTAPLINREDGSERDHDKTMDEGEKELTHVCLKINQENIVCAVESNKYGIGLPLITAYFNHFIQKIDGGLIISLVYLSMKGLSDILSKAQRISTVEMECSYSKTDEDLFRKAYGPGIKETFLVKLTPEKKESFGKDPILKIYDSVAPDGKVSRMKIAIKSEDGDDMILDTLMDKVRDQIFPSIDNNGVVISSHIFPELQKHLLKFED